MSGVVNNPFLDICKGKTVFVGIGNNLRGDDGIGPLIIEKLHRLTSCPCIDAGLVPENSFGPIAKENPDTVVIIDAVHLFLKPGAYRLLSAEEVLETGFSTHTLSPSVFMQYLKEATNAEVYLLGIQPVNTELGSGISAQLEESVDKIIPQIVQACGDA